MSRRGENIYRRKDGRWEGRVQKPEGGYSSIYGKTYMEVKQKKNDFKPSLQLKKSSVNNQNKASQLFENWLEGDLRNRIKSSTFESYFYCIKKYIIPYFASAQNNRITAQQIELFINHVQSLDISDSYKNKIISIFKVALKEILRNSIHCKQLTNIINVHKTGYVPIQVFSIKEQQQIELEILKTEDKRSLGVLLCFYTGIRLGELCALKWKNINIDESAMTIIETVSRIKDFNEMGSKTNLVIGSPKSANAIRKIPIPKFLMDLLLQNLNKTEDEENYILTGSDKPFDPRKYQRLFKKILKNAEVKERKFHTIRHTFATRALEMGIDIRTLSEILGHSSVLITLNVYSHSLMEHKISAINKLGGLYNTKYKNTSQLPSKLPSANRGTL